jgi:hypothetical protein
VDGGTIDVRADGVPAVGEAALRGWVESAARAVAGYYGRFPVARATLTVRTGGRGRVGYGTTWCRGGPLIRMAVGSSATQADLDDDWVLTHEMLHTAMPSLEDGSSWAEEGFATYVEPVARARRGGLSAERVWRDLVIGLPKGLPGPRDGGLDGTESWGRTYWGGALFWLLADIGIREKTSNARGLEDALRAILEQHGGVCSSLRLRAMLATGDRVAGVRVLEDLHARLGPRAEAVDLDALWRRLGVRLSEGKVTFDDRAPLAAIRRAITAERKGSDRR